MGIPELMILAVPLVVILLFLVLVVWLVRRSSKKSAPPAAPPAPYHSNLTEEISKLDDMMQKGSITQDEFLRMKNELIKKMST